MDALSKFQNKITHIKINYRKQLKIDGIPLKLKCFITHLRILVISEIN